MSEPSSPKVGDNVRSLLSDPDVPETAEVLVGVRSGVTDPDQRVRELAAEAGGTVVTSLGFDIYKLSVPPAEMELLTESESLEFVERPDRDSSLRLLGN